MQKILCQTAEDKKFLWYHLSLPHMGPHGILADPQAVPGPTRLPLLSVQESRSERYSAPSFSLPCTYRQLSGRTVWRLLVFIIALRYAFSLVYHQAHHKSTKKHSFSRIFPRAVRICRHKTEIRAAKRPPQQIQHTTNIHHLSTLIHQLRNFSAFCTISVHYLYGTSHLAKRHFPSYYIDTKR
jgi:hypothetical protein